MGQFLMPSLGADMEAGTLIEWLKAPGDQVARGDTIAVVETQKGAIEIEVFEDGVLDRYLVEIGEKVPVGTPLAVIGGAGGVAPAKVETPTPAMPPAPAPEPPPKPVSSQPTAVAPTKTAGARVRITPAALRRAEQSGLDPRALGHLATGPHDAITLDDIEAHLRTLTEPPTSTTPAPDQMGMRAAIAAAMARSKREIPHYYLAHTVDLTRAQAFITTQNDGRAPEDRLLIGALYLAAVARAATKFPEFNGHYTDGVFSPSAQVHAGMAITLRGGGLIAPAILDAGARDLNALMSALRDLAARVRAGRFRASELSDATITVTSLGERGVDQVYGVIYPPQVAIVGVGTPSERATASGGQVEARLAVTLTLAADHRVSDGHRGALFLRAIDKHLQNPEAL